MPYPSKPPVVVELEKLFGIFNDSIFGGELRTPTFTIQTDKKFLFRFFGASYQIFVGSALCKADFDKICLDLLHEMVHISNFTEDIADCTTGQYHNKRFLIKAVLAGLYVSYDKIKGWGITKFTRKNKTDEAPYAEQVNRRQKACELAKKRIDQKVLNQTRIEISSILAAKGKRKIFFLKYQCKCQSPHNSIRSGRRPDGARPLKILCMDCGQPFECVDI